MITRYAYFNKNPLLVLQLIGWTIYLIADVSSHLVKGHYLLTPSLISSISGCLLTGAVAMVANNTGHLGTKKQSVLFALLLLVAAMLWQKVLSVMHGEAEGWLGYARQFAAMLDYSPVQWLKTGYYPLFAFIAWGALFVGCKLFFAHQAQQSLLTRAQVKTKQAQLQTLRYQLNPHFLFNVLNSIDISILSDEKDTAHQMVMRLSGFLRNTLEYGEQDKIALEKEIDIIRDFAGIEQLRYGDAVCLSIELELGCEQVMVPSMILQPLVENAVKFAWSQAQSGQITLTAGKQQNNLVIEIINSCGAQEQARPGTGTGLKNTQERLALVYGEDASLVTRETPEQYKVLLTLPWELSL